MNTSTMIHKVAKRFEEGTATEIIADAIREEVSIDAGDIWMANKGFQNNPLMTLVKTVVISDTVIATHELFGKKQAARFWSLESGEVLKEIKVGQGRCGEIAASKEMLAYTEGGRTRVAIIEWKGEKLIKELHLEEGEEVVSMAFSPDGKLLAMGITSGMIKVISVEDWKCKTRVKYKQAVGYHDGAGEIKFLDGESIEARHLSTDPLSEKDWALRIQVESGLIEKEWEENRARYKFVRDEETGQHSAVKKVKVGSRTLKMTEWKPIQMR